MAFPAHVAWRDNALLAGLSADQLAALADIADERVFVDGETIVREGEDADEFYLICSGIVQVYRDKGGQELPIARMGAGHYFGVMALVDEQNRAASVRAIQNTSAVAISLSKFRAGAGEDAAQALLHAMLVNHAREQNRRLRETAGVATDALERELEKANALLRLGLMLVLLVTMTWVYVLVAQQLEAIPELRWLTTLGISVVMGACAVYMIRKGPYPLSFYGFTLAGWRVSVRDAVVWTLGLLAFMTAAKWILVSVVPQWEGLPVIDVRLLESSSPALFLALAAVVYVPVVALQELAARGILHASLGALLSGKWGRWWALVLSNAVFSLFHVHYSVAMAVGTFALGLFFGVLWMRHRSLLAVTVAHYMAGFWGIEVLDVLPLLGMRAG